MQGSKPPRPGQWIARAPSLPQHLRKPAPKTQADAGEDKCRSCKICATPFSEGAVVEGCTRCFSVICARCTTQRGKKCTACDCYYCMPCTSMLQGPCRKCTAMYCIPCLERKPADWICTADGSRVICGSCLRQRTEKNHKRTRQFEEVAKAIDDVLEPAAKRAADRDRCAVLARLLRNRKECL